MDEYEEIKLVTAALNALCRGDTRWDSNRVMYCYKYNDRERIIWWRRAKQQALLGVPAMQALMLKVIEIRLKG